MNLISTKKALAAMTVATSTLMGWLDARGQAPELERVEPAGGQRGITLQVRLVGDRLTRASDLLFYRPGITVESLTSVDEESATATLRIANECQLGEHPFRIVSPQGVSQAVTLQVGPFSTIDEVEPNSSAAAAQRLAPQSVERGMTIAGVVDEADVDCYRIPLQPGERLSAEVEAIRLGGALFDAQLEVLDPQGNVLAASDDTPLLKQDPLLSIVAKEAGEHIVQIREAAYGGDFESRYRLHLGSFARPVVSYPAGGTRGKVTSLKLIGDPRGELSIDFAAPIPGDWAAVRPPEAVPTPAPLPLRISDLKNYLEQEPNDSPGASTHATDLPVAINGILQEPGDEDYFRLRATRGEQFDLEVLGARVGSPIDSMLTLFGPDGQEIAFNDDGFIHDSSLRFVAMQTGEHVLRVQDHLRRGGPTHVYRVEVTPVRPKLELTTPQLSSLKPQDGQAIIVPRGGRQAMLVAARRRDFRGRVELDASNLPDGVSLVSQPIASEGHLGLLIFEAEHDAPLGATLTEIVGQAEIPDGVIRGSLRQTLPMVLGEPRQTVYHGLEVDRLPLVVTEAAPFAIDVLPPTMAISRDGRLELRIVAKRAKGFTGPIKLDAPLLPAWVERSEDPVTIPAGSEEVTFPLIAQDRAEPGSATLVVTATGRVDGAEVHTVSAPVAIQIKEPHAEVKIDRAAVELGGQALVRCHFDWRRPMIGKLIASLAGLPKHASAASQVVDGDISELVFEVATSNETPLAIHNTLWVELTASAHGVESTDHLGRGGVLEVFPRGGSASQRTPRLQILRRAAAMLPTLGDAP